METPESKRDEATSGSQLNRNVKRAKENTQAHYPLLRGAFPSPERWQVVLEGVQLPILDRRFRQTGRLTALALLGDSSWEATTAVVDCIASSLGAMRKVLKASPAYDGRSLAPGTDRANPSSCVLLLHCSCEQGTMLHSHRWDLHKGLERNSRAAKSDQSEHYDRGGRSVILQQRGPPAGTVRTCQATHAGRRWGVGHLHLHLTSRLLFSVHTFTPQQCQHTGKGASLPDLRAQSYL